jgi:pyocin large subunit-like protein
MEFGRWHLGHDGLQTQCSWCRNVRHKGKTEHEPRKSPAEITPELTEMRERLKAIYRESDNKQSGMKDGFVYVITNPVFPGWVSVGQSSDPVRRLTAYQRACPHRRFKLADYFYFRDRRKAEREVHRRFRKAGLKMKREWVQAPVQEVISFVQEVQRTSDVRSTNDPGVRS